MGVELDGIHHRSGLKKLWKNFVNGFKALIGQPILHDKVIPGLFPDMVNTKQGGVLQQAGRLHEEHGPFFTTA
ncbi:Mannosyl-oligosaccharide alpha-1,2-mannosidase 1B [Fusarium falciforme]